MVGKRISAPVTASALLIAGLVTAGSTTNVTVHPQAAPQSAPEAQLAAAATDQGPGEKSDPASAQTVGLVPAAPDAPRKLSAMVPPADGQIGNVPLQNIALPGGTGALGIPEIVLAAYRNAELALGSTTPGCGLPWNLLAGIGRIESGHASSGHTDAAGTTISPIFGPALDGTLANNEVIKAGDGSYVRALGPMQFLPGTWANYAADGNGDGVADPHNVFDAALAAGKYLCSGGLDLRDPQQQLKAVLRYNNSMSYAATVLSWSNAYKTGGTPALVDISAATVPPGSLGTGTAPDMTLASSTLPTTTTETAPGAATVAPQTQVMITIPGLPPIPCGVFCPAPVPAPTNCDQVRVPAQDGLPVDAKPEEGAQPNVVTVTIGLDGKAYGPDGKLLTDQSAATCQQATQEQPQQQVQQTPEQQIPAPEKTPEPGVVEPAEQAPAAVEPAPAAPAITLPFGITIPLPAPAAP